MLEVVGGLTEMFFCMVIQQEGFMHHVHSFIHTFIVRSCLIFLTVIEYLLYSGLDLGLRERKTSVAFVMWRVSWCPCSCEATAIERDFECGSGHYFLIIIDL